MIASKNLIKNLTINNVQETKEIYLNTMKNLYKEIVMYRLLVNQVLNQDQVLSQKLVFNLEQVINLVNPEIAISLNQVTVQKILYARKFR